MQKLNLKPGLTSNRWSSVHKTLVRLNMPSCPRHSMQPHAISGGNSNARDLGSLHPFWTPHLQQHAPCVSPASQI